MTDNINNPPLLQIIDADGEFTNELQDHIVKWNFHTKAFQYAVVAILGCQSSGKSTLLNFLFGTKFPTMHAEDGRYQTTQGVWLGLSEKNNESIVVLDVEGTDSRERGEEHMNFERKTSLFSLALAELLIVNMWAQDVGRYKGASLDLLKIVFELNLQLFQSSKTSKTLLLFVLRDHVQSTTPLEKLTSTIDNDMKKIWDGLTKPEQFKDSKATDFFDFKFTSLPHKELDKETFNNKAAVLRDRFWNPQNPDYLIHSSYLTDIPSDGFAQYAARIWETIKENKDLDLPTQKEMLAMYRCEEIMNMAYDGFARGVAGIKAALENGEMVDDFGKKAFALYTQCIQDYWGPASRYHSGPATKKKESLQTRVLDELKILFGNQISRIVARTNAFFDSLLKDALPEKTPAPDFAKLFGSVKESTLNFFVERADASVVPETDWSFEKELQELKKAIDARFTKERERQMQLLVEEVTGTVQGGLVPQLTKLLDAADPDMWARIREAYVSVKGLAAAKLKETLVGFECTADEVEQYTAEFDQKTFELLKSKVKEKSDYLMYKMEKKFDEIFRLDAHGLPRKWKPSDDVAGLCLKARKTAENLVDLFSIIRIHPEDDVLTWFADEKSGKTPALTKAHTTEVTRRPRSVQTNPLSLSTPDSTTTTTTTNITDDGTPATAEPSSSGTPPQQQQQQQQQQHIDETLVVISQEDSFQLRDRFRKQTEAAYMQALRDQEIISPITSVPTYMIVLIMVLGFNEFIMVLTNPLMLLLFILLGIGGYIVYLLNLGGASQQVLFSLLKTSMKGIGAAFQKLSEPEQRPPGSLNASKEKNQ